MVGSLEPILRSLVWDQLENIAIKIRIFSSTRTAVKADPPLAYTDPLLLTINNNNA